jgi:hypothetical protein
MEVFVMAHPESKPSTTEELLAMVRALPPEERERFETALLGDSAVVRRILTFTALYEIGDPCDPSNLYNFDPPADDSLNGLCLITRWNFTICATSSVAGHDSSNARWW